MLHASAVVRGGHAVLALGGKGAGKTMTALLLARYCGWRLLANDRIFVCGGPDGVRSCPGRLPPRSDSGSGCARPLTKEPKEPKGSVPEARRG